MDMIYKPRKVEVPEDRIEILEDSQYPAEYTQAYAAMNEAGDWEVHIGLIYDGDPQEIILDAGDAKALSGGLAIANSYIVKERTKARFSRKKTAKSE